MRRLGTAVGAVCALLLVAAASALADNPPTIVPAGFADTAITNLDGLLTEPVAVQFVQGSTQFYVAEKSGLVWRFAGPNDPHPIQVIDLQSQVNTVGDRGLLGMALAPSFTSSGGDIYLLYTADAPIGRTPPVWNDQCPDPPGDGGCIVSARLVRVTVDSLGHAGTPVPIIQNQWCEQFSSHSIGTVRFGPDGMLYVGAGDGASFNDTDWGQFGDAHNHNVNPCGDPANEGGALRAQDVRTNGDPAGLDGAILRVDTTGAAAAGNPYYGDPDANKARVLAYGFRNPYRFTFRPGTSDIFVGDVGWFTAEEIDKVPVDSTARDYGWPCYEGNGGGQGDYPTVPLCKSLLPSAVTSPVFAYGHGENVAAGDGCDFTAGSAISGMAFNSGTRYPSEYGGGLFFADYSRNCIWFMRKKANGDPDPSTVSVFARGAVEVGGPVDLEMMPNGNIAYVFLGWNGDSQIREIRWSGPKAALTATPTSGTFPLHVSFNAGGSTGSGLHYRWDLDGNGTWDPGPDAATTSGDYTVPRRAVTARVEVTDANGDSDIASVRIGAGTRPPATPTIKATVPAGGWAVGDPLKFTGAATDPDGDPLQYTWTLTILHCMVGGLCHTHPYAAATGSSATFTAPDHEWPSRLKVTLTASDGILTSTRSMELSPRGAHLTVRATPSPLKARLGGVEAPSVTKTLIAGSATTISANSPQRLNGLLYTFVGWSDGDRHRVRIVHPRVDTVLTARFQTPPASIAAPAVTGRARTDATQTAADGTWRGNELTFSHRWLRCNALGAACAPIPGEIGVAYQPTQADAGHRLRVIVTASNLLGAASAQSAPSAVLADRTPPEVRVSGKKRR
jgi:glucose/arabinose dehydrogenase